MSDPDPDLTTTGPLERPWTAPFVGEDAFDVPGAPLARGGMALVFEAEDRRLPRRVILKRPRADEHVGDDDRRAFAERLEAEALVLARLQHPSIVTLYELGRAPGGAPFCVLERVEGTPLRARLDELAEAELGAPARTAERLELIAGLVSIAEALAYAHERGIVHRDVTPNNILLGARGEMTLIDWGLAKDTTRDPGGPDPALAATAADGVPAGATICAGTPPYVCFEQSQGQPADPGYDVYSLGVTLYEVAAGRPPYAFELPRDPEARDRAVARFLRWAERGAPPPPAAPRDPELSGIIARAMARRPEDRFTADELVRALKQYLTGELVFSHRYSVSGRLARWVRRRPAVALSLAIAAAAVVAAGLVWSAAHAADAEQAQERARDEALVLAQRVEAAEAHARAAEAEGRAREAEDAAERARREGRESRALQAEAERLRRHAETQASRARDAAAEAAAGASEAQARWREAIAERDEAARARGEAETAKAAAEAARGIAERDRDAARAGQAKAEAARDAAQHDRAAAIDAREAAEQSRGRAEAQRDAAETARAAAEAARAAAEQARDAALARVRALEARVRELEGGGRGADAGAGGDPGDAPSP